MVWKIMFIQILGVIKIFQGMLTNHYKDKDEGLHYHVGVLLFDI